MPIPARVLWLTIFIAFVPLAWATSVVPPKLDELVAESDAIVRGVVAEVRAEEFDSPQGRGIRTLVTLRVEQTLKGSAEETITLVQLGGVVKGRALRVVGLPEFKVGERQIVFVAGNGRVICPVIGGGFGRFLVRKDMATGDDHIFRNDGAPLVSFDQISLPLASRPVIGPGIASPSAIARSEFEARILAVAAQLNPPNRAP
jgi:hypothetical protein